MAMRRSRRARLWNIGFLFLIYYCISVYSASVTPIPEDSAADTDVSPSPDFLSSGATPEENAASTIEASNEAQLPYAIPTWRPKRSNCTPTTIERYPRPLLGPTVRKHGGLVIHVLVAIYTFLGLAIVCNNYFVSSLHRICEKLKISPGVAGATFMAAGSSAPKLATMVMGTFFAYDDIGISGVMGSAVFNILFIISVCALCSGTVCQLNWWPLVRDCFFYALSILVMLIIVYNDVISWPESVVMLIFYVIYCITLHLNAPLEKWALSLNHPIKLPSKEEQYDQNNDYQAYMDPNAAWGDNSAPVPAPTQPFDTWQSDYITSQEEKAVTSPITHQYNAGQKPRVGQPQPHAGYYESKDTRGQELLSPLEKPVDRGLLALISWAIVYPIHSACRRTMPDCRTEKYRNWYPFTFFVSIIWISFYSYFMVWMITMIGQTLGIPDSVMGLTFVAAGLSAPDALSSIAVIKEGYGDMAVSNAVGSNVFDIFVCLGLPWFIQTAIIAPGSDAYVISEGLAYSTLSLLSTVVFLLLSTHLSGWKLDRRLGIILMLWYLIFITMASLYELNVFGDFNPPECAFRQWLVTSSDVESMSNFYSSLQSRK